MSVEPALGTRIYSTRNTGDKADRQLLNDSIQVMVSIVKAIFRGCLVFNCRMGSVILMIFARVAPRKASMSVGEAET